MPFLLNLKVKSDLGPCPAPGDIVSWDDGILEDSGSAFGGDADTNSCTCGIMRKLKEESQNVLDAKGVLGRG